MHMISGFERLRLLAALLNTRPVRWIARSPQARPDLYQINARITAVRKLAVEAADNGLLGPEPASGIALIKGIPSHGTRVGNWLSLRQAEALLNAPDVRTKKGLRDRAKFATLFIRMRSELANLTNETRSSTGQPLAHLRSSPGAAKSA
jgi:hypothetical protein